MLILQAMRTMRSVEPQTPNIELPIGWTETFEKRNDGLIYCRKCMFVTKYDDMVEPHLILHSCEGSNNSNLMLSNETEQTSAEGDSIMDLAKKDQNVDENSEYPKQPLRTYSRIVAMPVNNNNSSAENSPNPILEQNIDILNSRTVLQTSSLDGEFKMLKTKAKRKAINGPSERTRECANCGQLTKSIDVCDHTDAKASMNCEEHPCEVFILKRCSHSILILI